MTNPWGQPWTQTYTSTYLRWSGSLVDMPTPSAYRMQLEWSKVNVAGGSLNPTAKAWGEGSISAFRLSAWWAQKKKSENRSASLGLLSGWISSEYYCFDLRKISMNRQESISRHPTGGTKTRREENNEVWVCPELISVVMEMRHGRNVLKTKSVFNHPPPLTQVN